MRIGGLIEEVQGMQDRRSALYQSYEDAVNKFKSNKTLSSFMTNRKKIDSDHKQLTQQMATLLGKLKAENSDAAEKVSLVLEHAGGGNAGFAKLKTWIELIKPAHPPIQTFLNPSLTKTTLNL